MRENKLADLSMDFSIKIIKFIKDLKEQKESIISSKIECSGTSIGANIREAQYAYDKYKFYCKT